MATRYGLQLEHRRTQVEVQPAQVQVLRGQRLPHRNGGVPRLDGEAELGIKDAGGGVDVGVRVDARRHPQQYVLGLASLAGQVVQQFQLVEAVHHDPADGLLQRLLQLLRRLVVAVEVHVLQRRAGVDNGGQLAAGNHVEAQPLLAEHAGQRGVDVRLAGVGHLGSGRAPAELSDEGTALGAYSRLVQHVDRRAVLVGQGLSGTPADDQVPVSVDLGGVGKNGFREHEHHLAGVEFQYSEQAPSGSPVSRGREPGRGRIPGAHRRGRRQ